MKKQGIIAVLLIVLVLLGLWFILSDPKDLNAPHACPEEEKICPDGSSVFRTGNDCQFTECPGEDSENGEVDGGPSVSDGTNGDTGTDINKIEWETYTNNEWEYSFQYPKNYKLVAERDGFEILVSPPNYKNEKVDFFGVIVIQNPNLSGGETLAEKLFFQANLPDGKVAWLKDPKFYSYSNYGLGSQKISFGTNTKYPAFKVREKSINSSLGEYRSIVYVVRDPAIYRITHSLAAEKTHSEIIKHMEASFTVLD